jgi:hypothetical protein
LIGSFLLEDKNKTIHKIFHEKKDDDLQVMLFGEVKDLNYININDENNEIPYTNDMVMKYVNVLLKKNNFHTCTKMTINFYYDNLSSFFLEGNSLKIQICCYNHEGLKIAHINDGYTPIFSKYVYIHILKGDEYFGPIWMMKSVYNVKIVREYKTIREDIINKYFS